LPADILDETALNEAFASIREQAGAIDVVVANAASLAQGAIATTGVEEWYVENPW